MSDLVLELSYVTKVSVSKLELVLLYVVQGVFLVVLLLHEKLHHTVYFCELLIQVVEQGFAVGS